MEHYGVILFSRTQDAMKAEALGKEAALSVRLIPAPAVLKATCGFALKYDTAQEQGVLALLTCQNIAWEGLYHASRRGLSVTYEPAAQA